MADQLIALFLGAFQRVFGVIARFFGVVLRCLELQFQIVQLGKDAVQPLVVVGHMAAGGVDDVGGDAQLGTDQKGVGLARHADTELIGGHQRFYVEFAAGVDHAGRFQRIDLHLGIVGGRHQQAALAAQLLQNADRQRRALGGIGAGAQLVQQHQRTAAGDLQNMTDALHMTGEGRKALLNALLVADVHKVLVKMADGAALVRGNQKAVLRHGVEQPGGFQRHSLAAGVRTGDDQRVVFVTQGNIHRYDLFLVDQRVAGFVQLKAHAVVDGGHKGVLLHGKARLCQQQVDLQHGVVAVAELRLQTAHLRREGGQDAGDLLLLLRAQLHNAGVGFDHGGRLNKNGGAGAGNIVDDAAHLAAVLGAYRHDIAPVAQRNHGILQKFVGGGIFDDGIQLGADGILGLADLAAQIAQGDAGGVRHFIRGKNAFGNLALQHGLRCQRIKKVVGRQHFMLAQTVPLVQPRKIAQRGGNFQQLAHGQDAALLGVRHNAAHLVDAAEARAAVFDQQRVDGVGLRQRVALLLHRVKGLQVLHQGFGFAAGAKLHGARQNLVEF